MDRVRRTSCCEDLLLTASVEPASFSDPRSLGWLLRHREHVSDTDWEAVLPFLDAEHPARRVSDSGPSCRHDRVDSQSPARRGGRRSSRPGHSRPPESERHGRRRRHGGRPSLGPVPFSLFATVPVGPVAITGRRWSQPRRQWRTVPESRLRTRPARVPDDFPGPAACSTAPERRGPRGGPGRRPGRGDRVLVHGLPRIGNLEQTLYARRAPTQASQDLPIRRAWAGGWGLYSAADAGDSHGDYEARTPRR